MRMLTLEVSQVRDGRVFRCSWQQPVSTVLLRANPGLILEEELQRVNDRLTVELSQQPVPFEWTQEQIIALAQTQPPNDEFSAEHAQRTHQETLAEIRRQLVNTAAFQPPPPIPHPECPVADKADPFFS